MMQEVLERCHAKFIGSSHWIIKNKEKGWKLHIYKNVAYPGEDDNIWPWKVDGQFFSNDKHAEKYLMKRIEEKETGIRIIDHEKRPVPDICGVNGSACRHPNKCNTMLCSDCPIAEEFFAKRDGLTLRYQKSEDIAVNLK